MRTAVSYNRLGWQGTVHPGERRSDPRQLCWKCTTTRSSQTHQFSQETATLLIVGKIKSATKSTAAPLSILQSITGPPTSEAEQTELHTSRYEPNASQIAHDHSGLLKKY